MKKHMIFCIYMVALILFFTYALLDVFVIPHRYMPVQTAYADNNAGQSVGPGTTSDDSVDSADSFGVSSNDPAQIEYVPDVFDIEGDFDYEDDNIKISVSVNRYLDTDIHIAEIYLKDDDYLKTAFAEDTFGKNIKETTSQIAYSHDAILAINGDFYGARDDGYCIRDGVLYRDIAAPGTEDLVIFNDGTWMIVSEDDYTASELISMGADTLLCFGPGLVKDAEVSVTEDQEVGHAMQSNPRTAIGIVEERHYFFIVADGRTDDNQGLSLYELAEYMRDLGCVQAYNLDGGGSSTMYYQGEVINYPTSYDSYYYERSVSDIVYIGY